MPSSPLGAWVADAVCGGQTRLFFAPRGEQPAWRVRREAQARALCAVCPVAVECRQVGRDGTELGIWGGESEIDRARLGIVPPRAESWLREQAGGSG